MSEGPGDGPLLNAHLDIREGEDLSSESVEEAERWIRFYEELGAFEKRILASMEDLSARMPRDRRQAVEESNIIPMRELIDSFEQRASLWLVRLAELRGEKPT